MAVNIFTQSQDLLAGIFVARSTYGGEYIDPAYNVGGDNDAELADDYRGYLASQGWNILTEVELPTFDDNGGKATFTSGGLYNAKVKFGIEDTFDSQGLLAVNGDTLVLAFRGTDREDPLVEDGQTFIGASLAAHYKAFKPLINAAYDFLVAHPEVEKVVVTGHSLGGALVDVFTLADAARFRDLRPDGLTMVSLGSTGLPEDIAEHITITDPDAAVIGQKVIGEVLGVEITIDVIESLTPPADYVSIANNQDRAHFPNDFPDVPEDFGLAPIVTLKDNLHFGADLVFHNPNISNSDVIYMDPLENPLDFRGLGAEHNSALLYANLQGLDADPLLKFFTGQKLIFGVTDYNELPDWNGTPIQLFDGYIYIDDTANDHDKGAFSLIGNTLADYILGLSGSDRLEGKGGRDLLSGGKGDDVLLGGGGADFLAGGLGRDVLTGGAKADRFVFTDIAESAPDGLRDVISDFRAADLDRIDVSAIDAKAGTGGNQAFVFVGDSGFTAEGQIRAYQFGDDTIVQFNTSGAGGSDMSIRLKGFLADTLTPGDFIL